jgi:hypothetical protein
MAIYTSNFFGEAPSEEDMVGLRPAGCAVPRQKDFTGESPSCQGTLRLDNRDFRLFLHFAGSDSLRQL